MFSLLTDVLYFSIKDRDGKDLEVGDNFLTSFCGYDDGPFAILNLQPSVIVYTDLSGGLTVQHEMGSFQTILKHVYKVK